VKDFGKNFSKDAYFLHALRREAIVFTYTIGDCACHPAMESCGWADYDYL
jgi:hypothetical protein